MSTGFKAESRAALRLWWSFAWRQLLAVTSLTVGLGVLGALAVRLGLAGRDSVGVLLPWLFWPLLLLSQVDTFRRLIRLYHVRVGHE